MAPILEMLDGKVMDFVGLDQGFALPRLRAYRGRINVAIPAAGIILPEAKNPTTTPVVYSVTNLPTGLSFAPASRTVTGTPTAAHATRQVTYTATDSSTPAEVVTATFKFPVVGSTALITRDDWDNRGYGLETRTTYLLALLEGTVNVGASNVTVWRRPPDGAAIGLLLDDDGNTLTDYTDMTFTAGGETVFASRMTFLISQDRVELREATSPDVHFGNYISTTLGGPSLFLRTLADGENELTWDRGFGANGQWRRSSPDIGAFLQTIDSGVRFLVGVAAP